MSEKKEDVAPPGREEQVKALKEKGSVENPWAVAWASYNKSDENDPSWMGAKCDDCGQTVPVALSGTKADGPSQKIEGGVLTPTKDSVYAYQPHMDADGSAMCDGSGKEYKGDTVEQRGGKWVLLAKSTGKVLGTHATKEEAEAQERAVQASKHGDSSPRVRRFERSDFSSDLPKAEKTADGFWRVAGQVARTGIQEYRDGAGGVRRELRLPEDVRASLPSFALQPLTNDHPPQMVSPTNAKRFVVGAVGEAKMDGGWVKAPMTIYDAEAIAAVEGGRAQLSVGYSCRLEDASGEWNGQKYDAIQRDIVVNHVALVDMARAGSAARLRLDSGDAASGWLASDTFDNRESQVRTQQMPHELRIDGMVFQVNDPNAQAAHDRVVKQRDEAQAEAAKRVDNADKLAAQAKKDADLATAARDDMAAKLKVVVKVDGQEIAVGDLADAEKRDGFINPIVEKRAAERASLIVEARKHLGPNEVFDAHVDKAGKAIPAKSDLEIKRAVVAKLDKSVDLTGKSADYVQARFDAAVADAKKGRVTQADLARAHAAGGGAQPTEMPAEDERKDASDLTQDDVRAARERQNKRYLAINAANKR